MTEQQAKDALAQTCSEVELPDRAGTLEAMFDAELLKNDGDVDATFALIDTGLRKFAKVVVRNG